MAKLQFHVLAACRTILVCFLRKLLCKNMVENICAHRPKQIILCFKMGIESASVNIRFIDDFLHSNIFKPLFLKQSAKGTENRISCFSLPSVHNNLLSLLILFLHRETASLYLSNPADNHKAFRVDLSNQPFHFNQLSVGYHT